MRRIQKSSPPKKLPPTRNNSHANFTYNQTKTIAQINQVSARQHQTRHSPNNPFRILLPEYFNIPKFAEQPVLGDSPPLSHQELIARIRAEVQVKNKLRDLQVLAMGMRRAKSIKEESRYYFTQGVLLHNSRLYEKSIAAFDKFLKIVLFIKDEMSVELALNAIGIEYMHLKDYTKAIEYHKKQAEINPRSDQFASHVNLGLCYELTQDYQSALSEYRQAQSCIQLEGSDTRKKLVKQLIARVEQTLESPFVTASPQREKNSSFQMQGEREGRSMMRSRSGGNLDKNSRVQMAILAADEKMEDYLQSMRNSFVVDKEQ